MEEKRPREFCKCNLWIAPHDPRLVLVDGQRWHAACLKKERRSDTKPKGSPDDGRLSQHEQMAFRFVN